MAILMLTEGALHTKEARAMPGEVLRRSVALSSMPTDRTAATQRLASIAPVV